MKFPAAPKLRHVFSAPLTQKWQLPNDAERTLLLNHATAIKEATVWGNILEKKLRFICGDGVRIASFESFWIHYYIYHYGQCCTGRPIMAYGRRGGFCHTNAIHLWNLNRSRMELMRGFCCRLGEWFEHSWCVPKHENQVVETSQKMDVYYGFRFPADMAQEAYESISSDMGSPIKGETHFRQTNTGRRLKIVLPCYAS